VFRQQAADLTDLRGPERGFDGPADLPQNNVVRPCLSSAVNLSSLGIPAESGDTSARLQRHDTSRARRHAFPLTGVFRVSGGGIIRSAVLIRGGLPYGLPYLADHLTSVRLLHSSATRQRFAPHSKTNFMSEASSERLWALPAWIPRSRAADGGNCTVCTGGSVHEPVHALPWRSPFASYRTLPPPPTAGPYGARFASRQDDAFPMLQTVSARRFAGRRMANRDH
jgi:hypothetical protein